MDENKMGYEAAVTAAKSVIERFKDREWPDDYWQQLSEEWDLNLFSDEDGNFATLYPVYDGVTNTAEPFAVSVL